MISGTHFVSWPRKNFSCYMLNTKFTHELASIS